MTDLSESSARAELDRLGASLGRPLSIAEVTASTNDDALAALSAGALHGATFVAETQTKGRGRGGHAWHSPAHENLYFSVVLRPDVAPAQIAPVTLALGIAVARGIERSDPSGALEARIKWPNDVFIGAQKIAGLLVEGRLRGASLVGLVAGVGVNVKATEFPAEIDAIATSMVRAGAGDCDRSTLLARLLFEMGEALAAFERAGLSAFADELSSRDLLFGQRVTAGDQVGVGEGIDAQGRLLLRGDDDALHAITAGDVALVRPASR